MNKEESPSPHNDKVADHRYKDAKDITDIVNYTVGLLGKDKDDTRCFVSSLSNPAERCYTHVYRRPTSARGAK